MMAHLGGGLTAAFCCPVPVARRHSSSRGWSHNRPGALQVVDVAVGDNLLEPGPESKDDKQKDDRVTPGKRTFQFNVPWGGALIRLGDGGLPRNKCLPSSLVLPYGKVPEEGQTRFATSKFKTCDPAVGSCPLQQQIEVWEAPCRACNGSGFANARKSKRRESFPATCMMCSGIGFVRNSSFRVQPELTDLQ